MKDQSTPATKADIETLASQASRLNAQMGQLDSRVSRLDSRVEKLEARFDELRDKMDSNKEEIMRHFDVVAEHLFHELAGAHRDEIELLKDRKDDHERRICRLERAGGIVVA